MTSLEAVAPDDNQHMQLPRIDDVRMPPAFEIGAFHLRAMTVDDAQTWYEYLRDPATIEHTSFPQMELADVERMVAHQLAGYANGTGCRWAVADAGDRLVGTCGFSSWSIPHSHAELVYDLSPAYHGRGIMRAAIARVLGWAFDDAGFNRVHAHVMTTNAPSIRVLESSGFTREGTLREFRIARGTPRDFHLYARLRGDHVR